MSTIRDMYIELLEANDIDFKGNASNKTMKKLLEDNGIVIDTDDSLIMEEDDESAVMEDIEDDPRELEELKLKAFEMGVAVHPLWGIAEINAMFEQRVIDERNLSLMVGTVQQRTKRALELQPKVEIYIPVDQLNPQVKKIHVWVNGVKYGMPVGQSHRVPKTVAEIYMESLAKTNKALAKIKMQELTVE